MSYLVKVHKAPAEHSVALVGLATKPGGWLMKRPEFFPGDKVSMVMAFPRKAGATAYLGAVVRYLRLPVESLELVEYTFAWEATEETRSLPDMMEV